MSDIVSVKKGQHPTAGETVIVTYKDGHTIEVCSFCLGNCGQCGTSLGMGQPPLMDAMIRNLIGNGGVMK